MNTNFLHTQGFDFEVYFILFLAEILKKLLNPSKNLNKLYCIVNKVTSDVFYWIIIRLERSC